MRCICCRPFQPDFEPLRGLGGYEAIERIDGGREEDGVAALAGFVSEGRRDVAFAKADAAQQNDIGLLFDERCYRPQCRRKKSRDEAGVRS